jgi:hypothetical protein
MGRGSNADPDFDEFNSWARWIAEHDDLESPFSGPVDQDADGTATRES